MELGVGLSLLPPSSSPLPPPSSEVPQPQQGRVVAVVESNCRSGGTESASGSCRCPNGIIRMTRRKNKKNKNFHLQSLLDRSIIYILEQSLPQSLGRFVDGSGGGIINITNATTPRRIRRRRLRLQRRYGIEFENFNPIILLA